jgi:hypothetical protein
VLGGLILISSIVVYAASRAEREKTRVIFSSLAFRRIKRRERTVATSRVGISERSANAP